MIMHSVLTETVDNTNIYMTPPNVEKSKNEYKQIFMVLETINSNRRYYPKEQFYNNQKQLMEQIKEGKLLGELDHPETEDPNRMQYIKLSNVSHKITDLIVQGNTVYGKFVPLNTPMGVILQELLDSKVKVGISLRALGDITERSINGELVYYVVPNSFEIITFDAVSTPGFDKQYVITESLKYLEKLNNRNKLNSFEEKVLTIYLEKLKKHSKKK